MLALGWKLHVFYYKGPPIALQILSVQTLKVQLDFPEFISGYFDWVGVQWGTGICIYKKNLQGILRQVVWGPQFESLGNVLR